MDQVVNHAAKWRYMSGGQVSVPLVVRGPISNGIGMAAQHSQSLEAWFVHTPGLIVMMPSSAADAKGLLKSAIREDNPVVFLEKRLLYARRGPVPAGEHLVPVGVAEIKRPGTDVTVVATGMCVHQALQVGRGLAREGIEIEVIDPRTLKPLDMDTIGEACAKTGRLVVVSEGARAGGFASEVVARVIEDAWGALRAEPQRVTAKDTPIPYAASLERAVLPSVEDVETAIRATLAAAGSRLASRVAVVTGAAQRHRRRHGPAAVPRRARRWCSPTSRSDAGAPSRRRSPPTGGRARFEPCDVADAGDWDRVAAQRPRAIRRRSTSSSTTPTRTSCARRSSSTRTTGGGMLDVNLGPGLPLGARRACRDLFERAGAMVNVSSRARPRRLRRSRRLRRDARAR